ncbi:DmsC/YnfH family molybdoenzyme membrane anchor subunit [Shigella boydii]
MESEASGPSNEIAAGSIFFAVGGLWWLVAVIGKMPQALGKVSCYFSAWRWRHFRLDDDLRVSNRHSANLG